MACYVTVPEGGINTDEWFLSPLSSETGNEGSQVSDHSKEPLALHSILWFFHGMHVTDVNSIWWNPSTSCTQTKSFMDVPFTEHPLRLKTRPYSKINSITLWRWTSCSSTVHHCTVQHSTIWSILFWKTSWLQTRPKGRQRSWYLTKGEWNVVKCGIQDWGQQHASNYVNHPEPANLLSSFSTVGVKWPSYWMATLGSSDQNRCRGFHSFSMSKWGIILYWCGVHRSDDPKLDHVFKLSLDMGLHVNVALVTCMDNWMYIWLQVYGMSALELIDVCKAIWIFLLEVTGGLHGMCWGDVANIQQGVWLSVIVQEVFVWYFRLYNSAALPWAFHILEDLSWHARNVNNEPICAHSFVAVGTVWMLFHHSPQDSMLVCWSYCIQWAWTLMVGGSVSLPSGLIYSG